MDVGSHVDGASREILLIRMDEWVPWGDEQFLFIAVTGRHGFRLLDPLLRNGTVECSVVGVSAEDISAPSAWRSDRQRGGLAAIGQLRLLGIDGS